MRCEAMIRDPHFNPDFTSSCYPRWIQCTEEAVWTMLRANEHGPDFVRFTCDRHRGAQAWMETKSVNLSLVERHG